MDNGYTSRFTAALEHWLTKQKLPPLKEVARNFQYFARIADPQYRVRMEYDQKTGDTHIIFGVASGNNPQCSVNCCSFWLRGIPACCGIGLLHSFNYLEAGNVCTEELVHSLLKAALTERFANLSGTGNLAPSRRLLTVMVQNRAPGEEYTSTKGSDDLSSLIYDGIDPDIVRVGDVHFPWFYTFYAKNATKIKPSYMYNENSGNLLHTLEVLF